jgi:hypothetical protein
VEGLGEIGGGRGRGLELVEGIDSFLLCLDGKHTFNC